MKRLYTYGYGGPNPRQALEDLKGYAAVGVVLDIRLKPWSGIKVDGKLVFTKAALFNALAWPLVYGHCDLLGNVNYRGGPIQLKDPEGGMEYLRNLYVALSRDVVLLCGCEEAEYCHRKTVAELAVERGIVESYRHLERGEGVE